MQTRAIGKKKPANKVVGADRREVVCESGMATILVKKGYLR